MIVAFRRPDIDVPRHVLAYCTLFIFFSVGLAGETRVNRSKLARGSLVPALKRSAPVVSSSGMED